MTPRRFTFGPFVVDADGGTLTRDGVSVAIGHRGLSLLITLLQAGKRIVTKAELMDSAWPGIAVEESNLSVQMAALRKVLGPSPHGGEWISTVPRIGYRFAGSAGAEGGGPESPLSDPSGTARPSIAVLPLANVSGEREQEYLADGITDDIITALTRFRWFFVIARNSSFVYKGHLSDVKRVARELGVRYILEGSVRRSGQRIRVSAELVDATAGTQIWAERYDLDLTEVFAIQDDIAERIAGAIEPELLKSEAILAAARHTGHPTAWDLVRQGAWRFHQVTRATHFFARELFRQACQLDAQLPEAHFWRARVNAGIIAYGWSDDPITDVQEGFEAALTAIRLDEKNPYSHYSLAIVSIYGGNIEQGIRAAEKAAELTPSFALGHLVHGMAQLFSGNAAEAVAPLQRGVQLSPFDPQNFVWFNLLSLAHLFSGNAEAALQSALRALKIRPDWRPALETTACCYVALEKPDKARRLLAHLSECSPAPGDALAPLRKGNPHWVEQIRTMIETASSKQ